MTIKDYVVGAGQVVTGVRDIIREFKKVEADEHVLALITERALMAEEKVKQLEEENMKLRARIRALGGHNDD